MLLLFLPADYLTLLDLLDFVLKYKSSIAIIAIMSLVCLVTHFFCNLKEPCLAVQNSFPLNTNNLSDEERAILVLFIRIQCQNAHLDYDHPAVVGLKSKGFIIFSPSPIYFISDDKYMWFSLTNRGKKTLKSKRIKEKLSGNLDDNRIIEFVNSISDKKYSIHVPSQLIE